MNPTLGLLMPLMLGQPAGPGCDYCPPPRPPLLALMPQPPYFKQLCPPAGPPAPVLAVRAVLTDGMTVVATPADPKAASYPTGTTFGFRPGYRYQLKVDNLPDRPGESLYPVLEVRGSIVPRPGMKYMEYPASITVTKADVEKVVTGRMVTKVIYLEDPSRAVPQEATPDRPIEVGSDTVERAVREAEDNGRLVAILRVGDRVPTRDDLARQFVPGTVLVPGTTLGPAAAPPQFGCDAVPLYDPILGPKSSDLECFVNGGDIDSNLGLGPDGTVQPFRSTNTIAEYLAGSRRKFSTSNMVCLCVPRFVIRRADVGTSGVQGVTLPGATTQITGRDVFQQRSFTQSLVARERLLSLNARLRASQAEVLVGVHAFGSRTKPMGFGKVDGVAAVFTVSEVDEISNFPGQLVLTKAVAVDPPAGVPLAPGEKPLGPVKQGDVLTVTLNYYNNTRQPVTDLILSDSLSGRLEYVAGTAAADRPSNVTLAENDAGSQVVRFEIPGPIPPAASGKVVFKVKVR